MKKNKLFALFTILLLASVILTACQTTPTETEEPTAETEEPTDTPTEETEEPSNTIVDIAVADGRFTTLVTALQAAGLDETLAGEGPFTVFAPTDDAFGKLPEGTVEGLLEDIPTLTNILLYHVVSGEVLAEDVVGLEEAETLEGKNVDITVEDGNVFINDAQVIITDILADNGVIHVIDTVLQPPPEYLWTKNLRQAVAAAIDREVIVDRVFEGRNIPAYHMVPEGYPYATQPFFDKYGIRDLDLAIQLLTEEGYTEDNPFVFDLWYPPEHYGTTTADVMQVLKEQLEETGLMTVNLNSMNWAEYVDGFVAGDLPFFILGWFPDFADPENWLSPFASCLQSPDNGVNYCNEDMDALLQAAAASADPAEREDLYQQIGELYADDVPTIPLFWEPEFVSYRDGVEGVVVGAPFEFNYNVLSFTDDAAPASGSMDTIIIGTTDEVNSLDADDAYATHDWEIIKNTGAALLSYVPGTSELVPGAAAEMPVVSDDGLSYTFTLRDNLMFADGTPVTAQNYVDSWNRLNTLEGQVSGLIQLYVESVEAPDDLTVVYNLKDTFGFFPALAATAPFVVTNPATFVADEIVQFPDVLDGIGPYRMVSHSPGEQMVLEANPEYFGEAPLIPNVIVRYFADPTTMSNAIESGEIDVAWRTLGPVEAIRLQDVDGVTVDKVEAPALRYMVFNHTYMVGQ